MAERGEGGAGWVYSRKTIDIIRLLHWTLLESVIHSLNQEAWHTTNMHSQLTSEPSEPSRSLAKPSLCGDPVVGRGALPGRTGTSAS
jgi:hypothetical protein